ncbi:MAG TPA: hypothetical protein VK395_36270 [Gemmataceae bacterium]|nr:hypothetical protein [Gemmataceae bacterium]
MPSEFPLPSNSQPEDGLPVVEPPSGKFIAQLFLVPLLIVAVLVCFYVFVKWWVDSAWTPADYLARLDNPNPDIRWRGAQDLAQVLLRDEQLASDPRFALDLAERLRQALNRSAEAEKSAGAASHQPSAVELDQIRTTLRPEREYILYLTASLGSLAIPVGVLLLEEMILDKKGNDPLAIFQRRQHALWALANLGKNLQRSESLPQARREAVRTELEVEAAAPSERGQWARQALAYLDGPQAHSLKALGLEPLFIQCANDPNPFLREITALALNFWVGLPDENARMDDLLVTLTRDDGRGEDILAGVRAEENRLTGNRQDQQHADVPVGKFPGLTVRYNAAVALARRGSEKVRLGLLREMLDESILREKFRISASDGKDLPDEGLVQKTLEAGMQALIELHAKRPDLELGEFSTPLQELAGNSSMAVRNEAMRTLNALKKAQ